MSYTLPDYSEAKEQMVAVRYRAEQDLTRHAAVDVCVKLGITDLALELYSGLGGETRIYEPIFREIITNDLNPEAPSQYHLTAYNFILKHLPEKKIDLIDFDAYGCPSEEIKLYFSLRENRDAPFVLTLSDGLGLWMKRTRKPERIRERYLLGNFDFDERHPWQQHQLFLSMMMQFLAVKYNMKVSELASVQTKGKSYVLGSWLFQSVDNKVD